MVKRKDDLWKCAASPSGAHYWVYDSGPLWECKYCSGLAWFPRDQTDVVIYTSLLFRLGYKATQVVMQNSITRQIALREFRGGRYTRLMGQLVEIADIVE